MRKAPQRPSDTEARPPHLVRLSDNPLGSHLKNPPRHFTDRKVFQKAFRVTKRSATVSSLQFLNIALYENCLTSFATEFDSRFAGLPFPFHAAWLRTGTRPVAGDYLYARNWFGEGRTHQSRRQDREILP